MISETELSDLLTEAGEAIPTPAGVDAILEAARVTEPGLDGAPASPHHRFASRGFALKALGAAAVVALVVSIAVASSSPQPSNNAIHAVSLPALGASGSPGAFAKSASAAGPGVVRGSATTGNAISTPTPSPANSEKIITTGTLTLSVSATDLSRTVTRLQAIAGTLGGYVSQSNVALAGADRGGTVVLGIPAGDFQKAINDIGALGTVKHLATMANDVTGQVADLGAQLSALEAARTQLEALLARAGTISALLSVENEITSTQSQIQQLQAQQRVLANEISYSSLSVTIAPPARQGGQPRTGFSKAWHDAITHFVNGLSAFVADSGVVLFSVLLIAVIAILLLLAGRMVWSIVRRRLL
jgi:hypothetical protein